MASHWTFNGNIQNLQIFLYAPPEQKTTHSPSVPPSSTGDQPAGSTYGLPQHHIKEENSVDQDHKELPSSDANGSQFLDKRCDYDHNEIHVNCKPNIFMEPLPWSETPHVAPLESQPELFNTYKAEETLSISQDYLASSPPPPEYSLPEENTPNKTLARVPISQQNCLAAVLPSLRQLGITFSDISSEVESAASEETVTPCPCKLTTFSADQIPPLEPPLSLDELRWLERARAHSWTDAERELICILQRWYDPIGKWEAITKLFNSITQNTLLQRVVRAQWHNLKRFGPHHHIWEKVYDLTLFGDTEHFLEVRADIKAHAKILNINLQPRQQEQPLTTGNAEYSNSPYIQRLIKKMRARKAEQISQILFNGVDFRSALLEAAAAASIMNSPEHGFPSQTREEPEESEEPEEPEDLDIADHGTTLDDLNEVFTPTVTPTDQNIPSIVYRVFDEESQSQLFNGAIRSGLFGERRRGITTALSVEDELFDVFAENHFWYHKKGGPFISVTSSLLWAISIAVRSERAGRHPFIAVIDMGSLGSFWPASEVISGLREKGEFSEMTFQGVFEFLVWGEIRNSSILHVFPFSQLRELVRNNSAVQATLRLDCFQPRVLWTHKKLITSRLEINHSTAGAIGSIANIFGLSYGSEKMLWDFVSGVCQGWGLIAPEDNIAMEDLGTAFASSLDSHTQRRCLSEADYDEPRNAFITGAMNGRNLLKQMLAWSSGNRASKRRPT